METPKTVATPVGAPAPLVLPSETRMLALAADATEKLSNQTSQAQFVTFLEMDQEQLLSWLCLNS